MNAARNWDRLAAEPRVTRVQTPVARDTAILATNVAKASVVVDALLGTGVRGDLREPIRGAVELIAKARALGIPIVAVDTPTAMDMSSGDPSDPVVQADLTVTFHRPKTGLLTRRGAALAGRVLVAPIGIPLKADRG
jgi:NAD(P)H-hydrate epimerase